MVTLSAALLESRSPHRIRPIKSKALCHGEGIAIKCLFMGMNATT